MPPLDLPRLVMRRAAVVALVVLLLALLLGLVRMGDDIEEEVDAAMALAGVMAQLGSLADTDDTTALAALQAVKRDARLRHLLLHVRAADGSLLLAPPAPEAVALPMRWLLTWHREWLSAPDARHVAWQVPRPDAAPWTVSLTASHESERHEAMGSFIDMLLLLLGCVAGLLAVMRWNVSRAFAPLGRLLEAIARIEGHDARAVQALPTMPIRELEAVAAALRHLGAALESAEAQRRLLSQQVLTLQEDERARLARELHDEFGQRLTALRVDAAWLARRVAEQPALKSVVDGMSQQCERVQLDIRSLLTRLQPFGPSGETADAPVESLARLLALLRALVASWHAGHREGAAHDGCTRYALDLAWCDADGRAMAWPAGAESGALCLPRDLLLTLYRISQEALTNVARHARADEARLSLRCRGVAAPGQAVRIDWQCSDDGVGLPQAGSDGSTDARTNGGSAVKRGNGIAGLQERVWAQGGDLRWSALQPGGLRPGLRLEAGFNARLLPPSH
jgi:two-component system sensor histidine kinase UhpB